MLRAYQAEAVEAVTANWFPYTRRHGVVAIPTGGGKTFVIAEACRRILENKGQAVVLAHRKELLQQNAEKLEALLPAGSVGIYSAGLKSRDLEQPVIVAGIQSIYDKAYLLGRRHAVIVDECHLINDQAEGMYRRFLVELEGYNERLRLLGLTATPFRTGSGALCGPGNLFREIIYSVDMAKLIADGHLSPLTNRPAEIQYDTTNLRIIGGDYVNREMSELFTADDAKIAAAVAELVCKTTDRKSILVFSSGVEHARKVREAIAQATNEAPEVVTGESGSLERSTILSDFKAGRLRWLVNCDVLTTGFDSPRVDAIAILRATASACLFAQICGRGCRIFEGKKDCLILDFGNNIARHGPLDSPDYGRRNGGHGDKTGQAPEKPCPSCGIGCAISAKECADCGFIFPRSPVSLRHEERPDENGALLASQVVPPEPELWTVKAWAAGRHIKKRKGPAEEGEPKKPDTLRIDYTVRPVGIEGELGGKLISEWVCLEHPGAFMRRKARLWWEQHSLAPMPAGIDEAVDLIQRGAAAMPSAIETLPDGQFTRITQRTIGKLPESWIGEGDGGQVDEWAPAAGYPEDEIPF